MSEETKPIPHPMLKLSAILAGINALIDADFVFITGSFVHNGEWKPHRKTSPVTQATPEPTLLS